MTTNKIKADYEARRTVFNYLRSSLQIEEDHVVIIPELFNLFSESFPDQSVSKKKFTLLLREFLENKSDFSIKPLLKRTSYGLILTNVQLLNSNLFDPENEETDEDNLTKNLLTIRR